jgi:propionate CoA-transferase
MLRNNKFEAHILPMGTLFQMIRDIASGKTHTITNIGLCTFVDPLVEGGMMNEVTTKSLTERIEIKGQPFLLYELFPIDVAIIRGTTADEFGNISMEDEPVSLGIKAMAMAAKNSGGKVIVQVRRMTRGGAIHPRNVEVPGIMVDAIVVDPYQGVSGGEILNPALSGQIRMPEGEIKPVPPSLKKIIVNRAIEEIKGENLVVNLGVGIPVDIPPVLIEKGNDKRVVFFPEHGSIGGIPANRSVFGTNINPEAIIDSTHVFDFFRGGGLDMTFLGFGQIDAAGNVNVSKFNGIIPGCGGFIDITYKTPKIVFCGTFSAGDPDIRFENGQLTIVREGKYSKFVNEVEQITLNGKEAWRKGQEVYYITERAVFSLQEDGLMLEEVAPGIDVQSQVLNLIPFQVKVKQPLGLMKAEYFF